MTAALTLMIALLLPAATADEARLVAEGERLYGLYCATCHGSSGEGDGPAAEHLEVQPANLTRLSRANDGVFPEDRVRRMIDGRDDIGDHKRGAMPIWGLEFQELNEDTNQEAEVSAKIDRLILYLESIQKKKK